MLLRDAPKARAISVSRRTEEQVPWISWKCAFGINPGYTISNVQVNGADVPFSVSEYQEYNEAMLEVTLPADEQAELVME